MLKKTGILSHNALAFTITGAVLVGAIGAVLAFAPPRFSSSSHNAQSQPGKTALSGSSQQSAATATQQARAATPTATAKAPTPTSTPTLRGTVVSVDTNKNQFVVRQFNGGALTTVVVTSKTTYQGRTGSLSILQVGWRVTVKGSFQADGTFQAANVSYDD